MLAATRPTRTSILLAALAVLAGLAALDPAAADDRSLLRENFGQPYVFILFDTSGSMHWSTRCTQAQLDQGFCNFLCPSGDCFVPRNGDDPASKFFQAKEALFEVVQDIDDVQFGFGTYNQDSLRVQGKHWTYVATENGVRLDDGTVFPAQGSANIFGRTWDCPDNNNRDSGVGCDPGNPADLDDPWELERILRFPKLGQSNGETAERLYFRSSGRVYLVDYFPINDGVQKLGDPLFRADIHVHRCTNSSCGNNEHIQTKTMVFKLADEFLAWDIGESRTNPRLGFFSQGLSSDGPAGNTCEGWDPNTDSGSDQFSSYLARWPTTNTNDPRDRDASGNPRFPDFPRFTQGDIVPLDWETSHKQEVLERLAPNIGINGMAAPDFGVSSYFSNTFQGNESFLRLKNEAARPMVAFGSTPLGNSIKSFRIWWAGCAQGSCPRDIGWSDVAAEQDPDWGCRRKFLLVITDGDETCGGPDACSGTAALFAQEGVKTFVVAFGVQNTPGNRLTCMASNGGTGDPIFPQNKQELVAALSKIFGEIREEARAFASAAVPSVQAEVADKLFLSSFTPLNNESVWDGHLDAFLKPLPLKDDQTPDKDRQCSNSVEASCHLWDAGEVLKTQAPAQAILADPNSDRSVLKLGLTPQTRRVFYAQAKANEDQLPAKLRLFEPPVADPDSGDPDWVDLWQGLGIPVVVGDPASEDAAGDRARRIIKETLVTKESQIEAADGTIIPVSYVLGDIFHSNPVVLENPDDFALFAASPDCAGDDATLANYRCFADQHRRRRKMLVVGSNDAQLHFFEAGVFIPNPLDPQEGRFTNGTGKELFSYLPRLELPVVRQLAEGSRQIFGIDGTARIKDVLLDPVHDGKPDPDQREWRTVVIGGLREGGTIDGGGRVNGFVSGYYALDVTQPDRFDNDGNPDNAVVPSCLDLENNPKNGCGPLPFPAELWEFTDSAQGSRADEDLDGSPDLGDTWSAPTIGPIRVVENGRTVTKHVAIFGGGFDPFNKPDPQSGTWLYMVDVETGQAIYKRRLTGAAVADPAVIDADRDGFLDTIYMATTAGLVYKVDLSEAVDLDKLNLNKLLFLPPLAQNLNQVARITDPAWEPFPIFDTFGRPIYFAPTVFFVQERGQFALGFGTGDRENLWSFSGQEGRFYLVVDDNFSRDDFLSGALPNDETDYKRIAADSADVNPSFDFILRPETGQDPGWVLELAADERVIAPSFGLSGVILFSSFRPQVVVAGGGQGGGPRKDDAVCSRGGDSRLFLVFAGNANSLFLDDSGTATRSQLVPEFVSNPYVEQTATKNPPGQGGKHSDTLDVNQKRIVETLKKLAPKNARFANFWLSVKAVMSGTGVVTHATVPIAIVETNWKDF